MWKQYVIMDAPPIDSGAFACNVSFKEWLFCWRGNQQVDLLKMKVILHLLDQTKRKKKGLKIKLKLFFSCRRCNRIYSGSLWSTAFSKDCLDATFGRLHYFKCHAFTLCMPVLYLASWMDYHNPWLTDCRRLYLTSNTNGNEWTVYTGLHLPSKKFHKSLFNLIKIFVTEILNLTQCWVDWNVGEKMWFIGQSYHLRNV